MKFVLKLIGVGQVILILRKCFIAEMARHMLNFREQKAMDHGAHGLSTGRKGIQAQQVPLDLKVKLVQLVFKELLALLALLALKGRKVPKVRKALLAQVDILVQLLGLGLLLLQ